MTWEMALGFGILIVALALFVLDRYSVDFVAIMTMALILLFGPLLDVEPEEAISGFSNTATITVLFVFVLSEAVQRTGLINVLAARMVAWGGEAERRQLLTISGVVGPFSAFLNNTAAVAIMIPAVIRMAGEASRPASKLLIPLSYASQMAGVITLIGTSTNILASILSRDAGYGGFKMFEFSSIGIIVFFVGTLYLLFVAPRLLPAHSAEDALSLQEQAHIQIVEAVVHPDSDLLGGTLVTTNFRNRFQCTVIGIRKQGTLIRDRMRDVVFEAGDILILEGEPEPLDRVRRDPGLIILEEFQLDTVEIVIGPNSELVGATLREMDFRRRYRATVIAIRKSGELLRLDLGDVRLDFGDTLLVEGQPEVLDQFKRDPNLIVSEEQRLSEFRTEKIPYAAVILAGVVVVAALGQPILITVIIGSVLMVLTGCLTVSELRESIRWDVVFLLAGMIPLGIMLERTGGAQWLADIATSTSSFLPDIGVLFVFYVVTSLLTSIISNNAAVVLMVPVGIASALSLEADPRAFILAIMFAASTSFITPMGYQTNTMVLGPGGYKFIDFIRVGGPLNILLAVVTPVLIFYIWGL